MRSKQQRWSKESSSLINLLLIQRYNLQFNAIKLRVAFWIPQREEAYRQSFVTHIFIPNPPKPPTLRLEDWGQFKHTEHPTKAVACSLRRFADDTLIFSGSSQKKN